MVYVNILTGITHQVRITMQSLGHPLVADDRYLPKDQAVADCQWCPRNFLCEVRSETATNSYLHHASSFLGRLKRTHRLHCTSDGWRTNDCKIHVEMLLEDEICRASERVL